MFDDAVVHPPTKLETETEKKWFAAMRVSDIDTMRTLLRNEPEIIEAKDQYLAVNNLKKIDFNFSSCNLHRKSYTPNRNFIILRKFF